MNNLPWDNNSWEVAAQIAAQRSRHLVAGHLAAAQQVLGFTQFAEAKFEGRGSLREEQAEPPKDDAPKIELPQLLLQTVVDFGDKTDEGMLIKAVAIPWFEIIDPLKKDWNVAYEIDPRKWEEIIAGAYQKAGYDEVTLTERSGDHGRDVIAIKKGVGSVRVIDQVKRYTPPHLVTADDVRALMGVLQTDGASKGFLTTTSDFAPGLKTDPLIAPLIPIRLGLINGSELLKSLGEIAQR